MFKQLEYTDFVIMFVPGFDCSVRSKPGTNEKPRYNLNRLNTFSFLVSYISSIENGFEIMVQYLIYLIPGLNTGGGGHYF